MKYSELDEDLIFRAKEVFDRLVEEDAEGSFSDEYGTKLKFNFDLQNFDIPSLNGVEMYFYNKDNIELKPSFIDSHLKDRVVPYELVNEQLCFNLSGVLSKRQYIGRLLEDFKFIFKGNLIETLREHKYLTMSELRVLGNIGKGLNLAFTDLYKEPYFVDTSDYSAIENEVNFELKFKEYILEKMEDPHIIRRGTEMSRLIERYKWMIIEKKITLYLNNDLLKLSEAIYEIIHQSAQPLLPSAQEAKYEIEPELENSKRPAHKELIILLDKLGIFKLPIIESMEAEARGVLIGRLLGFSAKNCEDYIRYRHSKKEKDPYKVEKVDYEKNVTDFLKSVGIELKE